jgi:hypothetical protein
LALGHKIFALGAFLDIEGAFDNTSFETMGRACADHEVHYMISRWTAAIFSNRMFQAEIRGVRSTMMVRRCCPQGGVLSLLLWNMVINSLLVRLNTESLWAQGFADDIAIVINGKFLSTVCELLFGTELQFKYLNWNSHIDHRMQKATIAFW